MAEYGTVFCGGCHGFLNYDYPEASAVFRLMTSDEFRKAREAYAYPVVGLSGGLNDWELVWFSSTRQMDYHHHELLVAGENASVVFGYVSTVFWGHFSGQDGRIRKERANKRAEMARDKIVNLGIELASAGIRTALDFINSDRCGDALRVLCELPQLGPAFASKVCAFLAPAKCGVIDSNIASRYPQFGFSVDGNDNVKGTADNRARYDSYCSVLFETAEKLDALGQDFLWRDRDGTPQRWRAVDVERALFGAT